MPGLRKTLLGASFAAVVFSSTGAGATAPGLDTDDTRYLALGDSHSAGQGTVPQTQGFVYRLYQQGVFDSLPNTLLSNLGLVGGATSRDVLAHQVPLVSVFDPDVVTLTVGGNNLLEIVRAFPTFDDPVAFQQFAVQKIQVFAGDLFQILLGSCVTSNPTILVANQFDIPDISDAVPGGSLLLDAFNQSIDDTVMVVQGVIASSGLECRVAVVDLFGAFMGKKGLLLIDKRGAGPQEVHATDAGHRVIADAFREVYISLGP